MKIVDLQICHLRILDQLRLQPGTGINIVHGANAAGKTSVLEAIYLAGRGRSFRHSDAKPVIRTGSDEARVVIKLRDGYQNDGENGLGSTLGVARTARQLRCRLNGEEIRRRSQLAEALPVQWIGSQPQGLLELGPEVRRRFLDMTVFHVEHGYLEHLSAYQRALRQRNAAIRTGDRGAVKAWDEPLAVAAEAINARRQAVVEDLMASVRAQLDAWHFPIRLDYRYRPGWSTDRSLFDELSSRTTEDLERGFSSRGPHRAELVFSANDAHGRERVLAEKSLSRGQMKLFVISLNLALMDIVASVHGRGALPVLLVDDLAAELDMANREKVMGAIHERGCQAFLTRLSDDHLPTGTVKAPTVFHVEHGRLV